MPDGPSGIGRAYTERHGPPRRPPPADRRRPLLPGRRLSRRPLAAGRPRRDHPRPRRPRPPRQPSLPDDPTRAGASCAARMGPDADDRRGRLRRAGHDQRRPGLAPPGRAHPGLGPGAGRAPGLRRGSSRATTRSSPDATCTPFEPVPLPRVPHRIDLRPADLPLARSRRGLRRRSTPGGATQRRGRQGSLLFGYALGKAQRLLAGLDPIDRPDLLPRRGRAAEPPLPRGRHRPAADDRYAGDGANRDGVGRRAGRRRRPRRTARPGPASSAPASTAFASGWMTIRGTRRRRAGRPRLRPVRPRRLAGAARGDRGHRGRDRLGHARLLGRRRPLAARAGPRRPAPSPPASTASATTADADEPESRRCPPTGGRSA